MDGFKLNDVSDVYVGGTLAKQVYAGDTKIWDYKTPPAYTAPTAKAGLVYSGSAQALLNAGSTSHGTIQYSADGLSWSTSIPTSTNASASITVYWRLVGDGRHTDIASTAVVCSIAKAAPTYTAPTAKSGLVYNNTNQALLNAGSTSHGTIQYSSNGSTWGADIPTGKNATGYTVYWRLVGDSNHNSVSSTSIACSISKVTPTVTAPPAKTLTYSGSAQALVNAGSTNWGTLQYSLDNNTWSTSIPTGTNATSYTVYYKVVGNSNINDVAAKSVSCSIGKVTPTVTAPTAKVLTYNTSAQELVNAGSTNFGTLQYSLNNSTWGTTIPSATNQGSYTVYYRVVGNSNINDVASASVACSINEKKVTATVTLSQSTYTYSGSACKPAVTVKDGSTVIPASEYTVSYSNNVNAGTATVTISDNTGGNYEVIGSTTFAINKASGVAGVSGRSLTYSRGAQNLATVSGNTGTVHYRLGTSGSFSTTIPTATNAGSYTVQYYVDASANYNGVASSSSPSSVSTVIAQVTPVLSTSPSLVTGLTYNGSARNLLSGGAMKHSSSDTTAVSGTFSYTQQTNAGTYNNPTWNFTPSDTTNYKSTSGTITGSVTIAKAAGSVNISAISVSYNGSARNLVSVSGNTGTMHYRVGTSGSFSGTIPTATNAASYDIYWYMDASANYNGLHSSSSPAKVTSSIAKIDPTIIAPTAKTGLVFSGAEQTLWNAGSNTTAGSFSYSKGTNAGSYTATWSFTPTDTTNYNTKSGSATISIAQKALTITAKAQSIVYGNGISTGTGNVTSSGLVSGDSLTGVSLAASTSNVTTTGTITPSSATTTKGIANYSVTYATSTLTITARPINITAGSTSKTYDGTALTYNSATAEATGTNRGLVSGHTLSSCTVTGTITAKGSADNVASNAVIKSGTTDVTSNYSITYVKGTLTVNAKALTITAKNQSITYGSSISTGTGQVTVSGLVSGDSLTAVTLTASRSTVGSGTITPSAAATTKGIGNYSVTYTVGTLTVTAKALTITAKAQSIQWGNSIATGTGQVTVSGLISGDSLTAITLTPSTSDLTTTGTITPSSATTTNGIGNYSVTYTAGTLTVTQRAITITAKAQSVTFGTAITTGTGQVTIGGSGLASNNSLTAISLAASRTDVGSGTITPSAATIKNGTTDVTSKYSITYNTGTLTISAKALTITAKAQSISFGDSIATGTGQVTVSGLVSGDSLTAVTLTASTTAVTTSGTITPSAAKTTKGAGNYIITYNTGTLTISKRAITITAKAQTVTYGTAISQGTSYVTTSSLGRLTLSAITLTQSTTNVTTTGTITPSAATIKDGTTDVTTSCTLTYATGVLTINAKAISIPAPTGVSRAYNGNAASATFGACTGASITKYRYSTNNSTWTESTTNPTQTNAGTLYTQAYYTTDSNHSGSGWSASATIAIAKANQNAPTAVGASTTYPNTATATASGGGGQGTLTWTNGNTQSGTSVGSKTTKAYWAGNSNYNPSPYSNEVTLSVAKATPTVSLSATNRAYNGSALYATASVSAPSGGASPKGTIYYGTSSGATTYSVAYSGSGSVNLSSVSVTNVGSATVYAYFAPDSSCNGVYNNSANASKTFSVSKANQNAPTASVSAATYPNTSTATASGGGGQGSIEWSNGSSRSSVGTQTTKARWSGNGNYNASPYSNEVTLSVSKFTPTVTLSATNRAYNGSALYATASIATPTGGATMKGIIYYGTSAGAQTYNVAYNGSGSVNLSSVSVTNVGSATVYAYFVPDSSCNGVYNNSGNVSKTFSVSKVTPTVTAPTAKVLTYNGSAQALANAGSTNYGTLKYRIGTSGAWSTSVPTATDHTAAGYALYYMVEGNSNVNDVAAAGPVTCNINEKKVTATVTLSQNTYTYDGSAKKPTVTVKDGTTVIPASEYTVTYSNNTNAGTATVTISDNAHGNYEVVGSATFTINKATGSTGCSTRSLTYSRGAQTLLSVSGNTGTNHYRLGTSGSWTTSVPTGTNAGSYDVYVYTDASTNYNAVGSSSSPVKYTTTIAKATPVASTAPTKVSDWTYDGTAHNLASGGAMKHSSSDATAVGGTFTYDQATNAGSYSGKKWYFAPTDTTNYNSTNGTISGTVTVAQATGSATVSGRTVVYSRGAQNMVSVSNATGTMHYRVGTSGSWTTTIPTRTTVGSDTIYYYMDASTNYTARGSQSSPWGNVTGTVSKCTPVLSTSPTKTANWTYDGKSHALASGGAMKHSSSDATAVAGTFSYGTATNAGTHTATWSFTPTDTTNYASTSGNVGTVTVSQATGSATVTGANATYNRSAQNLLSVSGNTGTMHYRVGTSGSWTTNIPQSTNATEVTIYYYMDASTNYTARGTSSSPWGSVTGKVNKCTPVLSTSPTYRTGLSYTGSAQNLLTGGAMKHSSSDSTAVAGTFTYDTGTNAGTYSSKKWYFAPTDTTNYNSTNGTVSGSTSIAKINRSAFSVSMSGWTYGGTATNPSVSGNTESGSVSYEYKISGGTYSSTKPTSTSTAGTYYVKATAAATTNYNASTAETSFVIAKANISPTVSMSGWTYGGTANNPSVSGNPGSGSVTYHYKVQGAADSTYTTTKPSSAGSYTVRATIAATSNYNGNTCTVNFTIAQKEVTLTWGTVTWTYDKSAHSTTCTAGSLVSGDTCTVTLTGNSITNVGTTTVTASSLSNSNYKLPSARTKTLTVNARTVTLSWGTLSWTYDKTAHSTTCTAGNLCSGDTCTVTLTGNSITNKGTATVTASSLSNSNYALPSAKTATLTVNAREVTLSWGTTSWTYDGSAHSTTCTAGNLCSGDTCTVTLTGNSITHKGSTTVTASSLSNGNYKLPSANTKSISISAKSITLTWGTVTWTYDKTAHSTTCTATGLVGSDTCTVTLSGNSITNKGTTTVTASLGNSDYSASNPTATLTINARTVTLSWGTLSWTYDASAHSTTCTAGSLVSGDSCTVTLTGNSITNKGTTTVTASSLSNSNYKLPSGKTNTLTINARPINVTAASASKTYDGSALTSNSATAEATGTNRGLVSGHSMTSCTVTGTITNAGTANNIPSAAVIKSGSTNVTSNYSITYVNGTLTVNKATGSATVSGRTVTYSRGAQNMVSVSGNTGTMHYRVGTSGSWTTTIPTRTTAGSDTIYYYMDASTNYTARGSSSSPWSSVTGKVEKCTPVLSTSPTYRKKLSYTGSAQNLLTGGAMKHSSSDSTAVAGTFTYDQGTNAGTYSSKKWYFTPTDTTNYNNTDGTVSGSTSIAKINRSSFAVSMSGWTYGGTVTNPSVSGNTENGSVTYEYKISGGSYSSTKPTSTSTAGTYYVKATAAATTNYNASTAESTFVIARASRTISFTSAPSTVIKGNTISVAASPSAGSGDGSISFSSSDTTKATVSGSTVTGIAKGTVTITATISQGTNYNSASTSYTLTVAEWENALIWSNTLTWPA